ncbi:iron transporter [Mycobacterium antarcticum]|uniref:iron uptake transporter permease EfeU n=1 Tax=unclassified Mycolicibacterium TaxID=2636767 RepID=UPI00238A50B7|nr:MULTISPECIES: iron uptake transporter permease EfeU [unclassified Mycolicibacterium]BDX30595.1 iron transporter [Mycolicibacterium sp. TUM20985]GLP78566.1 iron transporter [Mycolicibacterium sp. TUM20983]GLP79718.1 iron transporter [Mycolicibacterium sp. TUM20984]
MTAVGEVSTSLMAAGPSVSSQLFGSALIGVREGLEAAIVVTILVAFLVKSDRRDALRWVWLGVGAAIGMTVAVFLVIQFGENTISGLGAEAIAGVASVIAVAIVTTMVIWMKKASASMSGQLRGDMARALEAGALAVFSLSFLAVGREGVETALFMVGFADAKTLWPLTGLVVGVLVAVAIAFGMYRGALRINLAKFFRYTGAFLIVVAAGILSYGVGALQTVGWLPGLASRPFDISSWFDWSSWYGQVVQGVFNVTPTPTWLQFISWALYLVIVLIVFLRPLRAPAKPAATPPPGTPPASADRTPEEPRSTATPERSTR